MSGRDLRSFLNSHRYSSLDTRLYDGKLVLYYMECVLYRADTRDHYLYFHSMLYGRIVYYPWYFAMHITHYTCRALNSLTIPLNSIDLYPTYL